MTKWNYRCDEVNLNHDQMIELNKDGLLKLIIAESLEKQIVSLVKEEFEKKEIKNISSGYKLTKGKIIAFGVLCVSLYLCIIGEWAWLWGVIIAIGFIVHDIIPAGMNTENIIDLAIKDAEIFEKIKEMEGWIFQIEEGKEKEYLVHKDNKDDGDENENLDEDQEEYLDRDDYEESEEDEDEDQNDNNEMTKDPQLFSKWLDKRVNDYGTYMVDNHTAVDIVDSSELPHPKEEILDAIIASVILDQDGESIGAMNAAALELAYHQENVGPERLSMLGVNTSEFMELSKSMLAKVNVDPEKIEKEGFSEEETDLLTEHAKKTAPTEDGEKKYEEFKVLVHLDTITICDKLEQANKLRESSYLEKLKGISALTNIPKYLKS